MESLLAYDADGNVVSTLDYMVAYAVDGNGERHVVGLIDFAANEVAGLEHTDTWVVEGAKGSKTWPEWLGLQAHDFRVELQGPAGGKRVAALVHKVSGFRRERTAVEAAIAAVVPDATGAKDIRPIVGGPSRPLGVDAQGHTLSRDAVSGTPVHLNVVGLG